LGLTNPVNFGTWNIRKFFGDGSVDRPIRASCVGAEYDYLITGAVVVDGTGAAGTRRDVAISQGRIMFPHTHTPARRVIDASGCILCPGFVDIHAHSDFFCLIDPSGESKLFDGVTTEVCGQCGSSPFPLRGALMERRREGFASFGLEIDWNDARGFFQRANDRGSSINRAFLVGHGTVRACVMGFDDRSPTRSELAEMVSEVERALEAGAFGVSTGLAYPPGCFARAGELAELCRPVARAGRVHSTHMRDEGDKLSEALAEVLDVSRKAKCKLQIAHIKTAGEKNWPKLAAARSVLDQAHADGLDVTCDRYPYTACSTDLDAIFPPRIHAGGIEAELERLRDPTIRRELEAQVLRERGDGLWEKIVLATFHHEPTRALIGKAVAEAAREAGQEPIDFVCDLLIAEETRVGIVMFNMSEENLRQILRWPEVTVGSDAAFRTTRGPLAKGKPHPRAFGTFSRVLGRYCREEGLFKWEEAISKMTDKPARRIGLEKRGRIAPGWHADVTIFDPETIWDHATYDEPHRHSEGIRYVFVNGELAIDSGEFTGALNGSVLRP